MADSWAVKYRPQDFKSLTGNERNGQILRESVKRNQTPPAIFLAGTRGSGKCIKKDSFIYTYKGIERISDIFPKGDFKPGTFIPFEYLLVNMYGELERTSFAYYNGVKPCRCFNTLHGFTVTCTYNHPLYVYSNDTNSFNWKLSSDLIKGDCLTIPVSIDLAELKEQMEFIEPDVLLRTGDFYVDPIVSIEDQVECETVDFTMPESHSFIANGLVNHNTTSARIYAKAMCCEHLHDDGEPCNECDSCKDIANGSYPDVIEVDAASENSVQGIRDLIKTLTYLPTRGDKKIVIIDECLTADTLVMRSDCVPLNISKFVDGDSVVSSDADNLVNKQISNVFVRDSETLIVKSFFDYITGSPNHRMLVYSDGNVSYKMLKDLKVGDSLVMPKKLPESSFNVHNPILGELLGIVMSDGILTPYCIQINVTKQYKIDYLDSRLELIVKTLDPSCRCNFNYDKRGNRLYRVYSKNLIALLKDYGVCVGSKGDSLYLDEKIFQFDRESRLMCFWSYTYFDGSNLPNTSTKKSIGIEVDGAGSNLIRGFNSLLHQMGVLGKFRLRERHLNNKKCLPLGYIRLSGPSLYSLLAVTRKELKDIEFLDLLEKRFERSFKTPVLERSIKFRATMNPQYVVEDYPNSLYEFSKIYEIEKGDVQKVYDFTVSDTHNFIANGFVSHNCHALSQAATNALLKTLEEPPEFVRFVFCTTDPQKVLETIRSRCLMFRFNDITARDIATRLRFIADQEGVLIDDAALNTIAKNSNGGMRDSIMLLEQAHLANVSGEMIKPSNILELVGSVSVRDIQKLFMCLKSGDHQQLLEWLDEEKFAPIDILNSSISFLETVVLIKQGVSPAEFVSKDLVAGVMSLASTISFHDVTVMFEEFRGIIYDLRSLNGVNSASLFRLRLLGVIDKLTYQPSFGGQGMVQPAQQLSFLQLVKSEFNVERIPLPDKAN